MAGEACGKPPARPYRRNAWLSRLERRILKGGAGRGGNSPTTDIQWAIQEHGAAVSHWERLRQAENSRVAERAERTIHALRIEGVGAVLDQDDAAFPAELDDLEKLRLRKSEIVCHDYSTHARLDRLAQIVEIDASRSVDAIETNAPRRPEYGVECGHGVVRWNEHDVGLLELSACSRFQMPFRHLKMKRHGAVVQGRRKASASRAADEDRYRQRRSCAHVGP